MEGRSESDGNFSMEGKGEIDGEIDGEEFIAIPSETKLDPNKLRCWSCLLNLDMLASVSFVAYTHPLLHFVVCRPCNARSEAIEHAVMDAKESKTPNIIYACSWCGLNDNEFELNDGILVECDNATCQRKFCTQCLTVSLGGDTDAYNHVMGIIQDLSNENWLCPGCEPSKFLGELKEAGAQQTSLGATVNDHDHEGQISHDEKLQGLLEQLHVAEVANREALSMLESTAIKDEKARLERLGEGVDATQKGLQAYIRHWDDQNSRAQDLASQLHVEIDVMDPDAVIGYYRTYWEGGLGEGDEDPDYKIHADRELGELGYSVHISSHSNQFVAHDSFFATVSLDERDEREGLPKHLFKGAGGYHPKNPDVLKLEPEDLNTTHLGEIEDVNTTDGALQVMEENKHKDSSTGWRITPTTDIDIEM